MDIEIDLFINKVPDADTAQRICDSIQRVLRDEHNVFVEVTFEDVSAEGPQ